MTFAQVRQSLAHIIDGALGLIALVILIGFLPGALKGSADQLMAASRRVPIHEGDRCHRCGRIITDPALAAEGLGASDVKKFRNIACILKYLNDSGDALDVAVVDRPSRRQVRPQGISFVRTTIDRRTGEEGYVAFYHPWSAATFAANEHATAPMTWDAVQASERIRSLAR